MATTYKRILLKLSGESLKGDQPGIFDEQRLVQYAEQIKEIRDMGVQVGIVIGGGNIFSGLKGAMKGFDRVKGDQMGMLATVINSLALSSALTAQGVKARVLTAVRMEPIGEFYNKWRAIECLEAGEVVIMSAGTGNPFLHRRPGERPHGHEIHRHHLRRSPQPQPPRHGPHRYLHVQGKQPAHHRLRHGHTGKPAESHCRGTHRYGGTQLMSD